MDAALSTRRPGWTSRLLILGSLCLGSACGGSDGSGADPVDPPPPVGDGGAPSIHEDASADPLTDSPPSPPPPDAPQDLLVHWQVNIEWTVEDMGETEFHRRILEKRHLPHVIAAQELWPQPLCGRNNAHGDESRESQQSCRDGLRPNSFMHLLREHTGRAWDVRYTGRNAQVVVWDPSRLTYVEGAHWRFGGTQASRDACCGGAATPAGCPDFGHRRPHPDTDILAIAVLLRDNRGTRGAEDDVLVGVVSIHTGGYSQPCIAAHLHHADEVFDGWERAHAQPLALRIVSGDLNKRADSQSETGAARRREENPDCWWRSMVRGHACSGTAGTYLDTVWHAQGDGRSLCSQWTYPMDTASPEADRCDRSGAGGGQTRQRIDYTFIDGPGLEPDRVSSHVDQGYFDRNGNGRFDPGEAYSDSHRGIYTEITY